MDLNLVDNIVFDGIDKEDYPDFCDAYIQYAEYNGVPMTDEQLEKVNSCHDFVYESLMDHLF